MRKHEIVLLGSAIILGTLAFDHLVSEPARLAPSRDSESVQRVSPQPDEFELPPAEVFDEIVARPLFSATRRPALAAMPLPEESEEVFEAPRPVGNKHAFKLTGVVVEGDEEIALIAYNGKTDHVRTGESIGGWRLQTVEGERVMLQQGTEQMELELRSYATGPGARISPAPANVAGQAYDDAVESLTDEDKRKLLKLLSEEGDEDILELLSKQNDDTEVRAP